MKIYPDAQIEGELNYPEDAQGDIYDGCKIFADLELGDKVHISADVNIMGREKVKIGSRTTIGPGVVIYTSSPEIEGGKNKYCSDHESISRKIDIGEDVFIGANSVIRKGVSIADGVVIGAGSFVRDSIEEEETLWAGNPAEKIDNIDRE